MQRHAPVSRRASSRSGLVNWYIVTTASEIAAPLTQASVSDGIGPRAVDALPPRPLDRGSAMTSSPRARSSRRRRRADWLDHGDARRGAPTRPPGSGARSPRPATPSAVIRSATSQRVRRDARVLATVMLNSDTKPRTEALLQHAQLVPPASCPRGTARAVERREDDGVGLAAHHRVTAAFRAARARRGRPRWPSPASSPLRRRRRSAQRHAAGASDPRACATLAGGEARQVGRLRSPRPPGRSPRRERSFMPSSGPMPLDRRRRMQAGPAMARLP